MNLSASHTICINQDLCNLRCAKESTTLEDKNILKCDNCGKAYTSDELATIAVDKQLNIDLSQVVSATEQQSLNVDTLWTTGTTLSKRAIIMELKLMNDMIRQMRELVPIPDFEDPRYKKILFFTNALRNLHKMNHTGKCFKADCFECRMKIPMKQCPSTEVQFEENRKEWYDWNGKKYTRQLFVLELQRKFIDCFVNTYNEIATASIGCNTNVVPAVDGGSIIYCTLYLSKNEQKDMENKFANTANLVLKKLIQLRDHDDHQERQQQQQQQQLDN